MEKGIFRNIFYFISAVLLTISFFLDGVFAEVYDWDDGGTFSITEIKKVIDECIGFDENNISMQIVALLPIFLVLLIAFCYYGAFNTVGILFTIVLIVNIITFIFMFSLMSKEAEGIGKSGFLMIAGYVCCIIAKNKD